MNGPQLQVSCKLAIDYGVKHHLVRSGPTRQRAQNSNRRHVAPEPNVHAMLANLTGMTFFLKTFPFFLLQHIYMCNI